MTQFWCFKMSELKKSKVKRFPTSMKCSTKSDQETSDQGGLFLHRFWPQVRQAHKVFPREQDDCSFLESCSFKRPSKRSMSCSLWAASKLNRKCHHCSSKRLQTQQSTYVFPAIHSTSVKKIKFKVVWETLNTSRVNFHAYLTHQVVCCYTEPSEWSSTIIGYIQPIWQCQTGNTVTENPLTQAVNMSVAVFSTFQKKIWAENIYLQIFKKNACWSTQLDACRVEFAPVLMSQILR